MLFPCKFISIKRQDYSIFSFTYFLNFRKENFNVLNKYRAFQDMDHGVLLNSLSSSCLLKDTTVGLPCVQVSGFRVMKSCFMRFSIWEEEQSAPALIALLHAMLLVTRSKIPVSSFIFPSERISEIISCTIRGSSSLPRTMGTAVTANESGPNSDILNPNSSR